MDRDDASEVLTRERLPPLPDEDRFPLHMEPEPDPSPLELAHLMAELHFLRAQLAVLEIELATQSRNRIIKEVSEHDDETIILADD